MNPVMTVIALLLQLMRGAVIMVGTLVVCALVMAFAVKVVALIATIAALWILITTAAHVSLGTVDSLVKPSLGLNLCQKPV
jgi:amino acid transporter